MPNRIERILRAVSLGLAAILVLQLALLVVRRNPLKGLEIPRAPQWTEESARAGTNSPPSTATNRTGTTLESKPPAAPTPGTNAELASRSATITNLQVTNLQAAKSGTTNLPTTNSPATATNIASAGSDRSSTNASPKTNIPAMAGPPGMPRPPFMGGPGEPGRKPMRPPQPLPAASQARVDRITSSEMLAPVFRPPPMALLGIAGYHAFIRTPSGQTAMLREGGTSDGIKLLQLGTNRVLIEQAGEKKELIIFNGLGSASLLTQ